MAIRGKHPFSVERNGIYVARSATMLEMCRCLRDVPNFFAIGTIRTTLFPAKL